MSSSRSTIILHCLCLQCNKFVWKEKLEEKKPLHCKVWFTLLLYSTSQRNRTKKLDFSYVIFFPCLCHHITFLVPPPLFPIIRHKQLPTHLLPPGWRNMWIIPYYKKVFWFRKFYFFIEIFFFCVCLKWNIRNFWFSGIASSLLN